MSMFSKRYNQRIQEGKCPRCDSQVDGSFVYCEVCRTEKRKSYTKRPTSIKKQAQTRARESGEKFYFTNVPCSAGHISKRTTIGGKCYECDQIYQLDYRKNRPEKILLQNALRRSKKFKVPFSITTQDILAVWPKDNRCPVLPDIVLNIEQDGISGPKDCSPTLDRFIPSLGYVPGNIAVISFKANRIKWTETNPAIFRAIADWIENKLEAGTGFKPVNSKVAACRDRSLRQPALEPLTGIEPAT